MSPRRHDLETLVDTASDPARSLAASVSALGNAARTLGATTTPGTSAPTTAPDALSGFASGVASSVASVVEAARAAESGVARTRRAPDHHAYVSDGLRAAGSYADNFGDIAHGIGGAIAPGTALGLLFDPTGTGVPAAVARAAGSTYDVFRDLLNLAGAAAGVIEDGNNLLPEVSAVFVVAGLPAHWAVRDAQLVEALDEPFVATVEVVSEAEVPAAGLAGRAASLWMFRGAAGLRVTPGIVRSVEDLGAVDRKRRFRFTLVASLWCLSLRRDSRIFQDLTAREIIERVLDDAGLYQGVLSRIWRFPREATARREFCVQYQESDLDFVSRLLQEEGIAYAVTGEGGAGERLTFFTRGDDACAVGLLRGAVVALRDDERSVLHEECVLRFDWSERMQSDGVVLRDYNFTAPDTLAALTVARHDGRRARDLVYECPARYHFFENDLDPVGDHHFAWHRSDARHLASVRLDELRAGEVVGRGESNAMNLRAGEFFELSGHPRDDLHDARFLLTRVEHRYRAPDVLRAEAGETHPTASHASWLAYSNRFECVPLKAPYRPRRVTQRPVIAGTQTAIVVGPEEHKDDPAQREDIHVDVHGRVKVRFHWDRAPGLAEAHEEEADGVRDDARSCWIRVAQTSAGAHWGSTFVPRRGTEVVVTFLDGDPDRPLIVGSVYNGTHRPRYAVEEQTHRAKSWISSPSTPGDDPERRNELDFNDLRGHEDFWIRAQRRHTVTVLGDHTTTVGGAQRASVGGDRHAEVRGDEDCAVAGTQRAVVEGDQRVRVGGAQAVTVGESVRVEAGGAWSLDAATVSVNAAGGAGLTMGAAKIELQHGASTAVVEALKIEFRCGASSIVMTPAGVVISGPVVKVG